MGVDRVDVPSEEKGARLQPAEVVCWLLNISATC